MNSAMLRAAITIIEMAIDAGNVFIDVTETSRKFFLIPSRRLAQSQHRMSNLIARETYSSTIQLPPFHFAKAYRHASKLNAAFSRFSNQRSFTLNSPVKIDSK